MPRILHRPQLWLPLVAFSSLAIGAQAWAQDGTPPTQPPQFQKPPGEGPGGPGQGGGAPSCQPGGPNGGQPGGPPGGQPSGPPGGQAPTGEHALVEDPPTGPGGPGSQPGGPGGQPGGQPGGGCGGDLKSGFLNRVWKFQGSVDSYSDGVLSMTLEKILNLPKKFKDQDDSLLDQDTFVLINDSVRVYDEHKDRISGNDVASALNKAESVRVHGKMLRRDKWRKDADDTSTPTIRAKKLYITG